jgi:molybdate transport system substrate-binding protein
MSAAAPPPPPTTGAQEVHVLSTLGLMGVIRELAARVEQAPGTARIVADFAPTAKLLERIAAGEAADIAILTAAAIDELAQAGTLARDSRTDLARSVVGVAVRAGATRPAIGSAEDFMRALLDAESIAYSRAGASGIFFADLIRRLGIAEQVNAKATVIPSGLTGELAARGEAEIAIQQVSELMEVPGIDIVGPLPAELDATTVFSGGVFSASPRQDAAAALLRFLSAAEAAPVYERKGLEPLGGGGRRGGTGPGRLS